MSRFRFYALMMKHKYQLIITYLLFSLEMLGGVLRWFISLGEAINDIVKGKLPGVVVLAVVHLSCY